MIIELHEINNARIKNNNVFCRCLIQLKIEYNVVSIKEIISEIEKDNSTLSDINGLTVRYFDGTIEVTGQNDKSVRDISRI